MQGSRDLTFLLKNMRPVPVSGTFVFTTVSEETYETLDTSALLVYREDEGITLVLRKEEAEKNSLSFENEWGLITLSVHSDLEAIGFLAKVTTALAEAGISTNVISAFYHDHVFVPFHHMKGALEVLNTLSKSISE